MSGMETEYWQSNTPLKTIVYRGGVLKFRIPSSWKEEYSDMDGGTFYEDRPYSGTLRVKVITLKVPTNVNHGSVLPEHARIVTFSYTVLGSDAATVRTLGELAVLDQEIRQTEFASKVGVGYDDTLEL